MAVPMLRTLLLYIAVIAAIRLMGKRQIGDLDPSELVVTILVSRHPDGIRPGANRHADRARDPFELSRA